MHKNLGAFSAESPVQLNQCPRGQRVITIMHTDGSGPTGKDELVFWMGKKKSDEDECNDQKKLYIQTLKVLQQSTSRQSLKEEL